VKRILISCLLSINDLGAELFQIFYSSGSVGVCEIANIQITLESREIRTRLSYSGIRIQDMTDLVSKLHYMTGFQSRGR
jgi:hypothetical protein